MLYRKWDRKYSKFGTFIGKLRERLNLQWRISLKFWPKF